MKRVLIACGNGIATSTMVAMKVKEALKDKGIEVKVEQCKLLEVPAKGGDYDVVVTTGRYDNTTNLTTPIISGMAFLTGINKAAVVDEIVAALNK
ncbi:MAG: PTS sugar transporter subunit IIB [Veillonella sp.]|uniref:PTS sugar transporter subunit IIB n=1 Tax=Veillonella sp. TaxID=1926307 RepID=UPI0025FB5D1F|nr:PTS sugar transporter subunit IIB [Veillonella sp.]MBS4912996.1 PTS sugar transporter subunit IIB [Veillonella sp.]